MACIRPAVLLRLLTIVLFVVTLGSLASAQPVPYYEKLVPGPVGYDGIMTKSCIGPNGSLYIVAEMSTLAQDSGTDQDFMVWRIGPDGSVLWQYQIPNPQAAEILIGDRIQQVKATPDGGVLVAIAYTDDDLGYTSINKLMKFSAAGILEWTRTTNIVTDMVVDATGNIFVDDWEYHHGGPNGAPTVSKITSDGQLAWSQSFGLDGQSTLSALQLDGSGGVTALGWVNGLVWHADDSYTSYYGICPVHFTGANDGGTAVTQTAFNGFRPGVQTRDSAGNYYAYGYVSNQPMLVKMDTAGNPVWQLPLGTGSRVEQLLTDPQSNLIALRASTSDTTPRTYYLQKFDTNDNSLWVKTLPNVTQDYIVDPGGNIFVLSNVPKSFGITKYLPNGDLGWPSLPYGAIIFSSTAPDNYAFDLQRDAEGRLYASGHFSYYPNGNATGLAVGKYGPANDAMFKSQTVPSTMTAGQTYNVTEAFTNTGIADWVSANGFYLRSSNPSDNTVFGKNHVDLAAGDDVAMGQSKYFNFSVIAPMTAGSYNMQWRMSQGTHAFGGSSTNKVITVVVRQNAARYITETIPVSVKAGSTFSVTVQMMNVGTTTWTQAAGFGLAPVGGQTWGLTKVPLIAADSIARGATKMFTFTCTAPATAGNYAMQFQMRRDSSTFTGAFGDVSPAATVAVTP